MYTLKVASSFYIGIPASSHVTRETKLFLCFTVKDKLKSESSVFEKHHGDRWGNSAAMRRSWLVGRAARRCCAEKLRRRTLSTIRNDVGTT